MWIGTKHGFYSIVEKTPGEFHIRARLKKDLQNLDVLFLDQSRRPTLPMIQKWPGADYRWRIVCDREFVAEFLQLVVQNLDYSNFKTEIAATPDQRAKLPAYHDLWHGLYAIQK